LVDLDTLLLEEGLIETRAIVDEDDNSPHDACGLVEDFKQRKFKDGAETDEEGEETGRTNGMEVDFGQKTGGGEQKEENARNSGILGNRWISSLTNQASWLRRDDSKSKVDSVDSYVIDEGHKMSPKEIRLERDLRSMANKCIELKLLLNEEKAKVETLMNRTGSLYKKRLAQEAITLRKEKDIMMHNAKAATWKLEELHVVNKVLSNKVSQSKGIVESLEDGLQRLQETFRTTVLDSLQADSQMRERITHLEAIVDSLTLPQTQSVDLDGFSGPTPRMNLPIRGRLEWKKETDYDRISYSSPACLMLVPLLKLPEKTPSSSVRRKAKFSRRSRKMGDSVGGLKKKEIASWSQLCQKLMLPRFYGDIHIAHIFSYQST